MSTLLQLFITFFKIGLFTIGGGYAMIPLIRQEVVQKGWVSYVDVMDFIAVSESTPGPFAVNISTFCGISTSGFAGAVTATAGVILPSFIIILFIAKFSGNILENKYVKYSLGALRPAIIALIFYVIIEFVRLSIFTKENIDSAVDKKAVTILFILIAYFVFKNYKKKKVNPILIILISALAGIIAYGILPLFGY